MQTIRKWLDEPLSWKFIFSTHECKSHCSSCATSCLGVNFKGDLTFFFVIDIFSHFTSSHSFAYLILWLVRIRHFDLSWVSIISKESCEYRKIQGCIFFIYSLFCSIFFLFILFITSVFHLFSYFFSTSLFISFSFLITYFSISFLVCLYLDKY